jgi:hypothetical protein
MALHSWRLFKILCRQKMEFTGHFRRHEMVSIEG